MRLYNSGYNSVPGIILGRVLEKNWNKLTINKRTVHIIMNTCKDNGNIVRINRKRKDVTTKIGVKQVCGLDLLFPILVDGVMKKLPKR